MVVKIGKEQVLFVSPAEADEMVQQHYIKLTGKHNGERIHNAATLYNPTTGEATIVVDSSLPKIIQKIFEFHEKVQHRRIREFVNSSGQSMEKTMPLIMPHAHFEALEAGYRLARRLKVFEQYQRIRGEK